jgi:ubiquinone/menaquinone biosynthesis C-methylase UbiE
MKIVELGCGPKKRNQESIGVDIFEFNGVDIVADINKGMSFFDDNSIDIIESYHFMEHLNDLSFFMSEAYRVLKIGGIIKGKVPHYANPYFYSDPTHRQYLGLYTFSYFQKNKNYFKRSVPTFYNNIDFEILKVDLLFKTFSEKNKIRKFYKKTIEKFVNKNTYRKELFEESFIWILPPYEIYFELKKK